MHWEAGTVWQPWSCSCSADARCPISYSQHSTKQNYSTLAATNTQTCARTHTHKCVHIHTHSVAQLRQREEGNNNVPFNAWRSMINLQDNNNKKKDGTSGAPCSSTYFTSWMFGKMWTDFNLHSHIVLCNHHCFVFNSHPVRPQEGRLYLAGEGKPSIITNRSRLVTHITSVLLCRNKLRKTHKNHMLRTFEDRDLWRRPSLAAPQPLTLQLKKAALQ